MLTCRPAKVIGGDKGRIGVGDRADITIIDPDAEWTINANAFYSKSRNCPYHGWTVRGKAVATLVAGEIRYLSPDFEGSNH